MILTIIQLEQSIAGAVISIAALLIVAGLIGYLTAWFYAKSVYTPVIKGLEKEKADLQAEVTGLKAEVDKLNTTIGDLEGRIKKLENELAQKEKELQDSGKKVKE